MNEEFLPLSQQIGSILRGKRLKLKTAESFTGGAVSAAIVMTAGASEYFDEGIICYSNSSKQKRLDVKEENLNFYSAVSFPVIRDMLKGLVSSGADFAAATTGNAGPGAENGEVGECYIGAASRNRIIIKRFDFNAERENARQKIINMGAIETLKLILEIIA